MIVAEDEVYDHHVERFKCPHCGRMRLYEFTRKKNDLKYPCDAYCEVCDTKYKAIDFNYRCQLCGDRVNCFLSYPIVMEEKDSYVSPRLSRVRKSHKGR